MTIGDSLTHGFKSLAVHDTDVSWPVLVARELGCEADFRYPSYPGPEAYPGLPLNLEALVRTLESERAGGPLPWRVALKAGHLLQALRTIKEYWERGEGASPPVDGAYQNNLAIYGWDLRDALSKDLGWCRDRIERHPWLHRPELMVTHNEERAAVRVLWGGANGDSTTQVTAARALGDEGSVESGDRPGDASPGIETLIVALGSNNALGSVLDLRLSWSGPGFDDVDRKDAYTVWTPEHFASELTLLAREIRQIRARQVIWATVPHVTIAPLAHGVGDRDPQSRYYPWYTRPWIPDAIFNPRINPCLSGDEARVIDAAIDSYNDAIKQMVLSARRDEQRDWRLLDLCGLLDRLAFRRYIDNDQSRPSWWTDDLSPLPDELASMPLPPDTRFLASDGRQRSQGGLIALDGVHPTTIGYAILAQEAIAVMEAGNVQFRDTQGDPRPTPVRLDFNHLAARDTLLCNPPTSLSSDFALIGAIDEILDLGCLLLGHRAL